MSALSRTEKQRLAALKKANRIRTHRKNMKQEVRSGRLDPVALLDDPACASMKAVDLLLLVPRIGRIKANRVLIRAGISPSRPLDQLTERQRYELFGPNGSERKAA